MATTTRMKQDLYIGKKLHASNFDELMEQVDLDGKFQRRFNLLYNLVYVVLVAMPYMNLVLVLAVPDHWCYLPGRGQTNMMEGETDAVDGYSKCQMFNISTPVNTSDMWGHRNLEVVGKNLVSLPEPRITLCQECHCQNLVSLFARSITARITYHCQNLVSLFARSVTARIS
uniref:Uncharacterized protein n=1 Tax=Timema shepardi TaxID=629360 RepID=A0A7R9B4L6_TIMSH|nr:unnamed protein product [Timema shepardi]